ncbi:hypothetical protein [Mesorhizobium sp. CAU 1741]|uniref:aldose epimerase family protein n=1 Tax=Mesorhizobium sp. CAU 1741 TaxID=3140366 RepID=UPI00325B14A7
MSGETAIHLRSGRLTASVAAQGAELRTLTVAGQELLWAPETALWDGTSQVLFPVVGRVIDDVVRVDGRAYPMPAHGFAPTSVFSLASCGEDFCILELRSSHATWIHYPYDFLLRLEYRLSNEGLSIHVKIHNLGKTVMPASFGLHPGFRWPLLPDVPKERHLLSFDESGPIACTRPVDRLVGPDRQELVLVRQALNLAPSLFEKSGIALLELQKRSLRYHTDDGRAGIRLAFPEMDRVMLWSRPSGDFLCIEPLLGHADPVGFSGELMEKPGMAHVLPGENLALSVTITPEFP